MGLPTWTLSRWKVPWTPCALLVRFRYFVLRKCRANKDLIVSAEVEALVLEDCAVDVRYTDGFRRGADSGRPKGVTAGSRHQKPHYESQCQEEEDGGRLPRPDWMCDDVSHCCDRSLVVDH